MEQIKLGDIVIDVELKDIKNVHLSVYPPNGRVRLAAPLRMDLDTIRVYAVNKLGWIKKQQEKFQGQIREAPREFLTKESHYYLGARYMLKVQEMDAPPKIILKHNTLEMRVRPDTSVRKRQTLLDEWYRARLKELVPEIITKWEKVMGVAVKEFAVKKMRTRWGTCNPEAGRIWLNLELAKKPFPCIEYIVVHEMVHLLERSHNDTFIAHMNHFLPEWKELRQELNKLPVSHVDWRY